MSREAGAPRACLWLSLSLPGPFITGPPVNTPGRIGGRRRGGGRREGSSCSVIFYTSGDVAQKTDKDRQKGEGGKNDNKGQRVEERGGRGLE